MASYRKLYPLTILTALLISTTIFVSGCTLKSGPKTFDPRMKSETVYAPEAPEVLAKAFKTTTTEGKKFYFSGWAGTKIQKRSNGYYVTGSMDREKGFTLDARIFGQPYRYYRWKDKVYISEGEKWREIDPSEVPLEPFVNFEKLQPLAGKAVRAGDEDILGKICSQYIITVDSAEAVQLAKNMGLSLSEGNQDLSSPYFNRLRMKIFIWVGQDDHMIYKFMTQTNMPVPGAGSFYQEVSFKFWKYNNPGLNHPGPQKIEPYLIKD